MEPAHKVFLFLAALSLALSFGCKKKPIQDAVDSEHSELPVDPPELLMEHLKVQSYGQKGLDWEMVSPVAKGFTHKNQMLASNLKIDLYREGRRSSVITADRGVLNTEKDTRRAKVEKPDEFGLEPGDMYMDGNVVVVSTDGSKLLTDWIRYRKSTDLIQSTAPVKVVRDDSKTTGQGLEATSDLTSVKIFNQTLVIKGKGTKK